VQSFYSATPSRSCSCLVVTIDTRLMRQWKLECMLADSMGAPETLRCFCGISERFSPTTLSASSAQPHVEAEGATPRAELMGELLWNGKIPDAAATGKNGGCRSVD
jgi:hypothetical protein